MQCVQFLNRAYSFRQLCERSEHALRELLGRPIHQTFLELKPMLSTETLLTNSIPEIVTSVTESFPAPITLGQTFSVTQNLSTSSCNITETSVTVNNATGSVSGVTENNNQQETVLEVASFESGFQNFNESETCSNLQKCDSQNLVEEQKCDEGDADVSMKFELYEEHAICDARKSQFYVDKLRFTY